MEENKIIIFAGTTEGRELAEYLGQRGVTVHICVATAYGESLLPKGEHITVTHERMDLSEMCAFMAMYKPSYVIDATHPYAKEVTKNLKKACQHCHRTYLRLVRKSGEMEDGICVDNVKEAVSYLEQTRGNILVTTGSKELEHYTRLTDYQERIYARVLSVKNAVEKCEELGIAGRHLICMQGPFSKDMNLAVLREYKIDYLVTKESGRTGGYKEKCQAAREAGAKLVVIRRPEQESGYSLKELYAYLKEALNLSDSWQVSLIGIGMGTENGLTVEAKKACQEAELLIGAKRMLEHVALEGQKSCEAYKPDEILSCIKAHPHVQKVAVVLSGDAGFYSGAKGLLKDLEGEPQMKAEVIPGIPSVVYLCAKLQISWEDAALISVHGRKENLISIVRNHKKTIALVGGAEGIRQICRELIEFDYGQLPLAIGTRLSYPEEKILRGTAETLQDYEGENLAVLYIENQEGGEGQAVHGIPDSAFSRGEVPMTKEEVRSVSLSKMKLRRNAIVYDIGAGTGSVSVEAALQADQGTVYAIEIKEEAAALLRKNRQRMKADNLVVIQGEAPEVLKELPAPDCVFIGGSKGHMKEILLAVIEKNPKVRVVVNAIALETLAEVVTCMKNLKHQDEDIVQVAVSKVRKTGQYHMMTGQNPVYVISFICDEEVG